MPSMAGVLYHVLVVDDESANVQILTRNLSQNGYRVTGASSGPEALEAVKASLPDLVVLDVFMPKVSGFDVLSALRANEATATMPVIIASALADTEHIVRGLNAGANDYVTKPFVMPVLFARVAALLRASEMVKRLEVQTEILSRMAAYDELTGLFNRRSLFHTLETEVSRGKRYRRELSLLMLDLDAFKRVNDTYGHPAGDQVLREFARRMRSVLRTMDAACRYGGEEFCAILPETSAAGAMTAAERIRSTCAAAPFETTAGAIPLTVSIGVATAAPNVAGTANDLLGQADNALLRAKRGGRNRVEHFGTTPAEPV